MNFPPIGNFEKYDTVFVFGMNNAKSMYSKGYGFMDIEVRFLTKIKWRKNPILNPKFVP